MKKNTYIYPAILTYYDNNNIGIEFPDLPGCISNASNIDEVPNASKDVLSLHLYGMEEDGFVIPPPTPLNMITLKKNQMPLLVEIYMPFYRDSIENVITKTTVTMPQWIKTIAEENRVNFSQLLQQALKEHLGIHHRR